MQAHKTLMFGVVAFVATLITVPVAATRESALPFQDPNVTVDPAQFEGLSFRHLSVFSRGGRVTGVTGVPGNPKLYYMGSTGGGVWKTEDAGSTWTALSDGFFEAGSVGAIEVAESD